MRKQLWLLSLLAVALASTISSRWWKRGPPRTPLAERPPLARVDFPKYETRKLANGLTVYAIEHREQPVVAIRLLIAAGAVNDPQTCREWHRSLRIY